MEAGNVKRMPGNTIQRLRPLFCLDTRFIRLRLVEEKDYLALHNLRTSEHARHLNAIAADPLAQQEYIRFAKHKAWLGEGLYYAISALPVIDEVAGFVRLADLNNQSFFSFHSLIVNQGAPAYVALDAIFTILQIGFDLLGYDRSDALTVRLNNERMRSLHRTMGILTEDCIEGEWVRLSAKKERYRERREFFQRFGFGLENPSSICIACCSRD